MSTNGSNDTPGANAMGDTLAFVKQLWGSMKIPGMAMPSLSPEDIDKQIADLKAVESWLQVNMNMLRGSIQALEVQSATLTALRSVGESFAKAASGAGASAPADDKPAFESPFQSSFQSSFQSPFEQAAQVGATADPASMAAPFANAAVWWNAMQEQFSNVVGQAMQQAVPPETKPSKKPAAKKPASSKTAATRKRATKNAAKPATKTSTKRGAKSAAKSASKNVSRGTTQGGAKGASNSE
ncbi:MAG: hypothetical protein LW709_05735 [Oxalobacteraceae bacterium]|jgi:hypothetical protein|nr:hypothetical protein [Oxalobacteraceae bacterium]